MAEENAVLNGAVFHLPRESEITVFAGFTAVADCFRTFFFFSALESCAHVIKCHGLMLPLAVVSDCVKKKLVTLKLSLNVSKHIDVTT